MNEHLKAEFLSLYQMVLADGVIDARELETLYRIGTEQYGIGQSEIINCVKNAGTSNVMPQKFENKIQFLYNLTQIAWADGHVDPTERDLLERYIIKMGFDETNMHKIADFLISEAQNGYDVDTVINHIME